MLASLGQRSAMYATAVRPTVAPPRPAGCPPSPRAAPDRLRAPVQGAAGGCGGDAVAVTCRKGGGANREPPTLGRAVSSDVALCSADASARCSSNVIVRPRLWCRWWSPSWSAQHRIGSRVSDACGPTRRREGTGRRRPGCPPGAVVLPCPPQPPRGPRGAGPHSRAAIRAAAAARGHTAQQLPKRASSALLSSSQICCASRKVARPTQRRTRTGVPARKSSAGQLPPQLLARKARHGYHHGERGWLQCWVMRPPRRRACWRTLAVVRPLPPRALQKRLCSPTFQF